MNPRTVHKQVIPRPSICPIVGQTMTDLIDLINQAKKRRASSGLRRLIDDIAPASRMAYPCKIGERSRRREQDMAVRKNQTQERQHPRLRTWHEAFAALLIYRKHYGDCRVPQAWFLWPRLANCLYLRKLR